MEKNKLSANDRIKRLCIKVSRQCKKNPYLVGLIFAVVVLVFIPAVIWLCYFLGDNDVCLIQTSLTVGDALGFYGTVLSFIGTTALGVIAVWQNKRLQHLEEVSQAKESSCSVYIRKKYDNAPNPINLSNDAGDTYQEAESKLGVIVENYSDAFLTEIEIDFAGQIFHSNVTMVKGEVKYFWINVPHNWNPSDAVINFIFTSCYGIKSYGDAKVQQDQGNWPDIEIKYYHFYGTSDKCKILSKQ